MDRAVTWESRQWRLEWSDEFDGAAGSPANSANWIIEIGSFGADHHELQYYCDRRENVALDGKGNLAITAREGNPGNDDCHYGKCRYTSARLSTRERVMAIYGRIEARIQIPRGQGIWPAFWMVGSQHDKGVWDVSGEIDIMENIGKEPRAIHGTLHGPGYYGGGGIGRVYSLSKPFADDFHVYAIDWDADAIRWYVDGTMFHKVTPDDLRGNPWLFNHAFYINLNVAVGGHWAGEPDATSVFPQTMLVDYVRIWKLAEPNTYRGTYSVPTR